MSYESCPCCQADVANNRSECTCTFDLCAKHAIERVAALDAEAPVLSIQLPEEAVASFRKIRHYTRGYSDAFNKSDDERVADLKAINARQAEELHDLYARYSTERAEVSRLKTLVADIEERLGREPDAMRPTKR